MKELPRIVHLTYREGMSAIFLSQVVRPMSLLQKEGYPVTLAVCSPIGEYIRPVLHKKWSEQCKIIKQNYGLKVRCFPSPPSRAIDLWDEKLIVKLWLQIYLKKYSKIILHCRGLRSTSMALQAFGSDHRFRIIYDCRGLSAEEFLYVRGYCSMEGVPPKIRFKANAIYETEREVIKRCHAIICVSEKMGKYIISKNEYSYNKVKVVPCCTDVNDGILATRTRNEMRKRTELHHRFVVAYCGSMAAWQMPIESLEIFKIILQLRSNGHFLAVTTQPTRMEELVEHVGIRKDQRTIVSVPHTEVMSYLAAADIGLLLREPSPVNHFASPVKFAEYLSCGLPVIISDYVGDYSDLIQQEGLGTVLPYNATIQQKKSLISGFLAMYETNYERIRFLCQKKSLLEMDTSRQINDISKLYQGLFSDCK